ncbi:MAG: hypothetical protein HQ446_05780 [Polaromonas sp.]|nr:hypothetical protein [Polaromonas sp.]
MSTMYSPYLLIRVKVRATGNDRTTGRYAARKTEDEVSAGLGTGRHRARPDQRSQIRTTCQVAVQERQHGPEATARFGRRQRADQKTVPQKRCDEVLSPLERHLVAGV